MDEVQLTLTVNEADRLHSLLVMRRHAFTHFCQQSFHHSPHLVAYQQELKALEAKLMQVPLAEYLELDDNYHSDTNEAACHNG